MSSFANFKTWLNGFEKTLPGKLTLSFVRAFVGVFIAAESQLFNAVAGLVGSPTTVEFNVLKSLVVALIGAAVVAGVRAVQHYFFDTPPTPTPPAPPAK